MLYLLCFIEKLIHSPTTLATMNTTHQRNHFLPKRGSSKNSLLSILVLTYFALMVMANIAESLPTEGAFGEDEGNRFRICKFCFLVYIELCYFTSLVHRWPTWGSCIILSYGKT